MVRPRPAPLPPAPCAFEAQPRCVPSRASLRRTAVLVAALAGASAFARATVLRCELEGTVDAGSAAYLADCVRAAERDGDAALLVRIDTPGGSLEATQQIATAFLGARVPILVWVGPAGARAGSAGTFLVLASNLAGMAEATRIGAAHPVGLTGEDVGKKDEHLAAKVENDAAAFAVGIARARGRNAAWAERAVRESVSVGATEAQKLGVVELVAPSEAAFLEASDGRTVKIQDSDVRLATAGAEIVALQPSLQQRLLHTLANPALAYLLLLLGGFGILIELS